MPFPPKFRIEREQERLDDPWVSATVWIAQRRHKSGYRGDLGIAQRGLNPPAVFFLAEFFLHSVSEAEVGELGNPAGAKIVMQNAAVIIEIAVEIGEAVHGENAFERRRIERGNAFLHHAEIRWAEHADLAV